MVPRERGWRRCCGWLSAQPRSGRRIRGDGEWLGAFGGWNGPSALMTFTDCYLGRWPRLVWGRAVGARGGAGYRSHLERAGAGAGLTDLQYYFGMTYPGLRSRTRFSLGYNLAGFQPFEIVKIKVYPESTTGIVQQPTIPPAYNRRVMAGLGGGAGDSMEPGLAALLRLGFTTTAHPSGGGCGPTAQEACPHFSRAPTGEPARQRHGVRRPSPPLPAGRPNRAQINRNRYMATA